MRIHRQNRPGKHINSILLIQLGDIGDVVLTLPAIRALRNNFPEAKIVAAVRKKAGDIMSDCRWLTDVLTIDTEKRSFLDELHHQRNFFNVVRNYRFDLAIDAKAGNRSAILALLSGAKQRIGFYDPGGSFWQNKIFTDLVNPERRPGRHMAEHYLNILKPCNITTEDIWPEYAVPEERHRQVQQLFRATGIPPDCKLVAVHPFSLWTYKEWRIERYVQLINWLEETYNVVVVITGSTDERPRAETMMKECGSNTYNLAGKTSIGALAAVLKACSLFIGVDSAGLHIAAAVGTPTVGIFGPSSISDWAPRGPQHKMIYKDLPCVPCKNKGCDDSEVSRCLEELTFDEVKDVIMRHLAGILSNSLS